MCAKFAGYKTYDCEDKTTQGRDTFSVRNYSLCIHFVVFNDHQEK